MARSAGRGMAMPSAGRRAVAVARCALVTGKGCGHSATVRSTGPKRRQFAMLGGSGNGEGAIAPSREARAVRRNWRSVLRAQARSAGRWKAIEDDQRRWRVSAEPVARPWETASRRTAARRAQAAAERSDVPRHAWARRWGEPPATGAERPSHGGDRARVRLHAPASAARSDRRERRGQGSSPGRRRPRSGLRGAGRGEAAPGGIEPGDRSEGPGGRPYFRIGEADDIGSLPIRNEQG